MHAARRPLPGRFGAIPPVRADALVPVPQPIPDRNGGHLPGIRCQNVQVRNLPAGVSALGEAVVGLGWVSELFVGGSAATGDYVRGVSDLDLVAVTSSEVGPKRRADLVALHRDLDSGAAAGLRLGCVYVHETSLGDLHAAHPTWTHGMLVDRCLSGVARAELVRSGYAALGRAPKTSLLR